MLDIVRHLDPVVGVDVHTVFVPPTSPSPVPIPHPHVGVVLDLREQVNAICPAIGDAANFVEGKVGNLSMLANLVKNPVQSIIGMASSQIGNAVATAMFGPQNAGSNAPVKANGMLRSTIGTKSFHIPGLHFPLGTGFGPPDPVPSQDANSFMGSKTVSVNGDLLSYMALPSLSCWFVGMPPIGGSSPHTNRSHKSLPTSTQLPIPLGKRVVVGGSPTINWHAAVAALVTAASTAAITAAASAAQDKITDRNSQKKNEQNTTDKQDCGDPVNIVTGEVVITDTDFILPGRVPLGWSRSYGGQYHVCGHLGHNWESVADTRLEIINENNKLLVVATFWDYETVFDGIPLKNGWEHRIYDGQNGHALYLNNGSFVIRTNKQQEYGFEFNLSNFEQQLINLCQHQSKEKIKLLLNKLQDRAGNGWLFERNTQSRLTQLIEVCLQQPTGRYIQCLYKKNNQKIPYITALILRLADNPHYQHILVQYDYSDQQHDLTCVTDANGHPYHYHYDNEHQITQHTNRNGFSFFYIYQHFPDGIKRVIETKAEDGSYHHKLTYHLDRQETINITPLGHKEILQYDDRNLPITYIDALGGVTTYEYDGLCRLIAEVDQEGHRTEWKYDRRGNIVEEVFADKTKIKTVFDEDNLAITLIDGQSNQWLQEFNVHGKVSKQTMPSGMIRELFYDEKNQLIQLNEAHQMKTAFDYGQWGFISKITNSLEQSYHYQHDICGNLIQVIYPTQENACYQYDLNNQLIKALTKDKRVYHYHYDRQGNLICYNDNQQKELRFEYWGPGKLVRRINPDRSEIRFEYNKTGQLAAIYNQKNQSWQLKRDALGRINEEVDYLGQAHHYDYDRAGRLIKVIDPLKNVIALTRDPLGRLLKKIANNEDTTLEQYKYDQCGRLVEANNQYAKIKCQYNQIGALSKEIQQQQAGCAVLDYGYNELNQLTEQTNQFFIQGQDKALISQKTAYQYNSAGYVTSQQIDDSDPIQFQYDVLGQLTHQQLNPLLAHSFHYTAAGQLAGQSFFAQGKESNRIDYQYDPQGNLIRKNDSLSGSDHYQYDILDQIIQHTDPLQRVEQFIYDLCGNRYTERLQPDNSQLGRRLYFPKDMAYQLDKNGQTIIRASKIQQQKLTWDVYGNLSAVDNHIYIYDALGRRLAKSVGQQEKTYFIWYKNALAAEVSQNKLADAYKINFYSYYLNTFIPLNRQSMLTTHQAILQKESYFYQNDLNGAPLRLRDEQGKIVWSAHYNTLGKATVLAGTEFHQPLRLQGQYFDEESGLHYNRHRYYDPETGMFISQDPIGLVGGLNPYQFAVNTLMHIDPFGLKADFIVSPNGTVVSTAKDINLVSTSNDGKWFQIHFTHDHDGLSPHTHYPKQNDKNVTREYKPTSAEDLDFADEKLKDGEMRERDNRKDKGGCQSTQN